MNQRPKTSGRPPTGLINRPMTTMNRAVIDNRPPTMARRSSVGGTARPGSRAALGTSQGRTLAAPITVVDRPMTQQGLGGMKTAGQRNQRLVQDKTYFQAMLRTKMGELNTEISKLTKEVDHLSQEQSTYLTYDKRAKALAQEHNDLQGELGDYNMLVDKLNTDTETEDVNREYLELKAQNEQEGKAVDFLFAERREKENQQKELEREIDEERRVSEKLVSSMNPEMQQTYVQLKHTNSALQEEMDKLQQELDAVNSKNAALEDQIAISQIKQEAVKLHEKLREVEEKRDTLIEEERNRGTPAQEEERLLKQVKRDNQERATMERQSNEIAEQITKAREELHQVEQDLEESQNERSQKYRELKKRDENMTQFLDTFEETKQAELERKSHTERNIVELMEKMSRHLGHFHHLPSIQEFNSLKDDLIFKEGEMEKSKLTATSLAQTHSKISLDLQKIDQLEEKIKNEIQVLQKKLRTMEEEIVIFQNVDQVNKSGENRQFQLSEKRQELSKQLQFMKHSLEEVQTAYDGIKMKLHENETHLQLTNLERKWQHLEQNNFAIREFIASKQAETDYQQLSKSVFREVTAYNKLLQTHGSDNALKR